MVLSISCFTLATTSSMRPGCILPSRKSLSRLILAISRLTVSKHESITASGVSSIITSTPVAISSDLIFLPSLPMILPFISSLGNATTDTVVFVTCSAAHFWIATESVSFAFLLADSFALSSICMKRTCASCCASSSILCRKSFFASSTLKPDIL